VRRPLYQLKAEFFKTLGHPARIRVLELLSQREHAVGELLPEVGIEPANLSQQLAVLRRTGLVTTRKEGSGQVELLDDLRTPVPSARGHEESDSRGS
jgi:DNA-binding transcriptional ArsR family regulator